MEAVTPPTLRGRYGALLERFDTSWVALEVRIAVIVILGEIGALSFWIVLKGLSSGQAGAGTLVRFVLIGSILVLVARQVNRRASSAFRRSAGLAIAVIVGLGLAQLGRNTGAAYFANLLNWMQSASTLALFGGLRGIATRLTLCLALLGASLATASGKHINVDVVMRFLPDRLRIAVAATTWSFSAVVCVLAAIGFADHIAIASFKAPALEPCSVGATQVCDVKPWTKVVYVAREVKLDMFLLKEQLSLDWKTIPRVLRGERYSTYLKAREWNRWLRKGNWANHYPVDQVNLLFMSEQDSEGSRAPLVVVPGGADSASGLLIREANFIFPFGLTAIALRFFLRALLILAGRARVDPDAAHEDGPHSC